MDKIRTVVKRLECQADDALAQGGFAPADRSIDCAVSLRYFGQEHTLDTPLLADDDIVSLQRRFDALHKQRYGHTMSDPVQLVHVRVRGIGRTPRPRLQTIPRRDSGAASARSTRKAFCFAQRALVDFAVYDRGTLRDGDVVPGPAIVEENTTTLVFFSDQRATVDCYGHLFITRTTPT
jgi:N-methylhydantoinase A